MSPITLFDKSFIQALGIDEAAWFDHFFLTNICPIFYSETLADLKNENKTRTPEQEVGGIARKFPDKNGFPCLHHHWLSINNMLGHEVPMTGQIPAHGKLVKVSDELCHVQNEIPEADDFLRWANQIFSPAEREYAHKWRCDVSNIKFEEIAEVFRLNGINHKTCKSLDEALKFAKIMVNSIHKSVEQMSDAIERIGVCPEDFDKILERWIGSGCKPLTVFAPYVAHVITVEIFFNVASAAGLIPCDSHSWLDMCYLHYLPFCAVFVSLDKLHRRCARLFMRPDQQFVWGEDLKNDLIDLNEHYLVLPEEIKMKGMSFFAAIPPKDKQSLTAEIWDRHVPGWRVKKERKAVHVSRANADLIERIAKITSAPLLSRGERDAVSYSEDSLLIKRPVRRKKGSWWQLPSDI